MATPASGAKPTNASQAIKGSERSSMSPEFLSGDKNSKQDAAKKGLRNLEQESTEGGFYNNGAGEDAGDVDTSRFSENNPDSGYTNAVSGYDDDEDDGEDEEPSRARKGPLIAILSAILGLGAIMGGSQAMLPFSLLEQLKTTYDSISTSMQARSNTFLRLQLKNGEIKSPFAKKYFGFLSPNGERFKLSTKQQEKLSAEGIYTKDIDVGGESKTIMIFDDGSDNPKVVAPDAETAAKLKNTDLGEMVIGGRSLRIDTGDPQSFEVKFNENSDFRNGYIKSSRTWRGAIGAWFDTMTARFLKSNSLTRNRFKDFQDRVNAEAEGNTRSKIISDMMHEGRQNVSMESGEKKVVDNNGTQLDADENGNILIDREGEKVRVGAQDVDIDERSSRIVVGSKMDVDNAAENFQTMAGASKSEKASSTAGTIANAMCGITSFIGTVQVAIAAQQGLQLVQLVSSYFEAIDKVKAGDGVDSPINEMSTWLTQPADVVTVSQADGAGDDYTREGFYRTKEEVSKNDTTAMQSQGIAHLYGGGKIDPHDPSVENFNVSSKISGIMKTIGASAKTFATCAAAKMGAAIVGAISDIATLIACLIPGVGWGVCLGELGLKFLGGLSFNIAVGVGITAAAKILAPIFISAFTRDLLSGIAGEDLGNAIASGTNIFMGTNARSGGQAVASREAYVAYRVEQEKILAEKAKYERETLSPFDVSSPNTFLGSIMSQLTALGTTTNSPMGILSVSANMIANSIKNALPTATALDISENLMTEEEFEDLCPTLSSIGAIGDAYCNPYVVTDISTIGMNPDDVVLSVEDQLIQTEGPDYGKIDPDSNLAKYILYCSNRGSSFGVADTNISADFDSFSVNLQVNSSSAAVNNAMDIYNAAANSTIGGIPIIGDAIDMISNANQLYNMGWISGESCVIGNNAKDSIDQALASNPNPEKFKEDVSGGSINWDEARIYQRYVEDQRLLESINSDYTSTVTAFLDEYYEENPLDESYEGILARASGLSKETIISMLDRVDYYNYIANYEPTERYLFGGSKKEMAPDQDVIDEPIEPTLTIGVIQYYDYGPRKRDAATI